METSASRYFLQQFPTEALLYRQDATFALFHAGKGCLVFADSDSAGAIGEAQGQAILHALRLLERKSPKTLYLWLNSAGAHFKEPLSGLLHLNSILEALWQFKIRPCPIHVFSNGWLYGGMAMSVCACADAIFLTTSAQLHLLGHRAYEADSKSTPQNKNASINSAQGLNPADVLAHQAFKNTRCNKNTEISKPLKREGLWSSIDAKSKHPPYPKIERMSDEIWWNRLLESAYAG